MAEAIHGETERNHATGGTSMADAGYLDFRLAKEQATHWSPRQTLLFTVGASLLLWSAIALGVYSLI